VNPTPERSRAVTVILRDALGTAVGAPAPDPAEAASPQADPSPPDKEE
jgi:hypothetical protein